MRHHSIGVATQSLLARAGLSATITNATQSTPLPNGPTDGFDVPEVTTTTTETDVHLRRLQDPYVVRDPTGEQSQANVSIFIPSDVAVTDGDESDESATRITITSSGRTYRVLTVHQYGGGVVRAMCVEE